MVAEAGLDVSRFSSPEHFASWTGLVARASGSAGKQKSGLPMTKAGRSIVKWALHMAANIARQRDPQLREFYRRLRDNGKAHNLAITAVAHKLARRYWSIMTDQRPYETRPPN
jgi:transposase